jgi:hypothetical protein
MIMRRVDSGDNKGKMAYVSKRPYMPSLLDDLQREYGGGTFLVRLIDGEGRFVTGGARTVVLEGAPIAPGAAPVAAAAPPVDPRAERMDRLFEALVTGLVTRPAPVVASPLEDMARIAELLKTMVPTSKGSDRELDMYLRGRAEGEKAAQQLAALANAGGDETAAIAQIGAPLIDLMKQTMERNASARPAQVAPNAPPPQQQLDVSPFWVQMIRPYKRDLLARAQARKNARVYANMVVEDLPDALLPKVYETVSDPDFLAKFLAAFPEFNATVEMQQWVAEFIDEARELLGPESDGGADDDMAEVANG